jgi:ribonuclease P/MRP protein subunit RPP1
MFEAVRVAPDGETTPSRFAVTAARYGYDGVVVRANTDDRLSFDADAVADAAGVDVAAGLEIRAPDPSRASGYLGGFRPEYPVLLLRGGTPGLNRFAVESDRIDVLASPMAGDGDFNHVLAKAAVEHDVRVEFDLGPVLRESGGPRVQALRSLRKLRELVEQYDVPYVVSAAPTSHLQLRAPRELLAVGDVVGFTADQVEAGLREWGAIVARNRERLSDSFIGPGVKRGRYEEEP